MDATHEPSFGARESANARLTIFLLILCGGSAVWLFKDLPLNLATYLIGLWGLAALVGALWFKHRQAGFLNAEVIFLGGAALQYLLAPLLLRALTNNLTDFRLVDIDLTIERKIVHDAHAGAMLIVLAYLGVFLLTSYFIRRADLPREADGTFQARFTRGSLWLAGGLVVLLWSTRLILLKTGSFYHLNRSEFQFEDPRYSLLAQIDSMIGPLVVTFFFVRSLLCRDAMFLPSLAIVGMDVIWNFVSGSRERALMVFLSVGVAFMLVRRRIPTKWILPAAVAGILAIGFMDYYRYAVRESGSPTEIQMQHVLEALDEAKDKSESVGFQQTAVNAVARLNDLDPVAAIYYWVPDNVDYLRGETYWNVLYSLVPRFLWADKPTLTLPINDWFFTNEGGSSPTTIMGEGYLNFGWLGVVLAAVGSALLLRGAERFLCRHADNPLFLPIYVSFLLNVSRIHTQPASIWLGFMFKYCLLILGVHVLLRFIEQPSHRSAPHLEPASLACKSET